MSEVLRRTYNRRSPPLVIDITHTCAWRLALNRDRPLLSWAGLRDKLAEVLAAPVRLALEWRGRCWCWRRWGWCCGSWRTLDSGSVRTVGRSLLSRARAACYREGLTGTGPMAGCGFTLDGGIPLAAVSVCRACLAGKTTNAITSASATASEATRISARECRLTRIAPSPIGCPRRERP
jgi:hypothetical protein